MSEENIIPKGRFPARVTEAVLAWTTQQKPQVAIGFEFLDQSAVAGKQITHYGSLSDTVISKGKNEGRKVVELTLDDLETCGWDGAGLSAASLASCVGTEVSLVIDHDEDDKGVTRAKVRFINAPNSVGAAVKERLNESETANVEKQFSALLMKRKQQRSAKNAAMNGGNRRHAAGRGDAYEGDDLDDLPFK